MLATILISLSVLIILLVLRINGFMAFLIAAVIGGLLAGMDLATIADAIEKGLGDTLGSLVIILGFGAVIGRMLAVTGAAGRISSEIIRVAGHRHLKWAVMLSGFIIGVPMFFAVGFVILVPILFSVAKRANVPILYLGIPLLASLSVTHGLLPPHPGPVALVMQFHADMGETILWGMVIGVPIILIAGPVFATMIKKIESKPLKVFEENNQQHGEIPSLSLSLICALLPVVLLVLDTVLGPFIGEGTVLRSIIQGISHPVIAMLISTILILLLLGKATNMKVEEIMKLSEEAIKGIAMILLIIGGAGVLKEVLVQGGMNQYLAQAIEGIPLSPVIMCWGMAVVIRLAVGSATVAALTTAGILAPVYASSGINPVVLVLATGSGSLIFSHVNDSGFWLVKEYFNLTVKQTFMSWSVMETIIAVCGLAGSLILNIFI